MSRVLTTLFVLCALLSTSAAGQSRCLQEGAPWSCVGFMELEQGDGRAFIRLIRYANGESMLEVETPSGTKQHLTVLPSGVALYSGLTDDESPKAGARNPFMFLDMVFTYPFTALQLVYPAGPASVPQEARDTPVTLEKHPGTLTVSRLSPYQIRFRLVLHDDSKLMLDGIWDGRLREPLPNSLSIANWRHELMNSFATLRDARSLTR
jgi:hypothetical protein